MDGRHKIPCTHASCALKRNLKVERNKQIEKLFLKFHNRPITFMPHDRQKAFQKM